tara:strand:- start:770 stop:1162 length:393 start_codon:yes stop_codon:yes gene_type:complete
MLIKSEEGSNSLKHYYSDKKADLLAEKKKYRVETVRNAPLLGKKSTLASPSDWVRDTIDAITRGDFITESMNMKEILQAVNEVYNYLEGKVESSSWKAIREAATNVHKDLSLQTLSIEDFVRILMCCGLN